MICRSNDAWALWYLGYPDQGLTQIDDALTLAQQNGAPLQPEFCLGFCGRVPSVPPRGACAQEHAEAAISLATEQGFPYWMALVLSCVTGRWRSKDRHRQGSSR